MTVNSLSYFIKEEDFNTDCDEREPLPQVILISGGVQEWIRDIGLNLYVRIVISRTRLPVRKPWNYAAAALNFKERHSNRINSCGAHRPPKETRASVATAYPFGY